jgi:hypothetical protein
MSENACCEICDECGGEKPSAEEAKDMARGMIEAMTRDLAANPDLAAKLFITLKMAAEPKR